MRINSEVKVNIDFEQDYYVPNFMKIDSIDDTLSGLHQAIDYFNKDKEFGKFKNFTNIEYFRARRKDNHIVTLSFMGTFSLRISGENSIDGDKLDAENVKALLREKIEKECGRNFKFNFVIINYKRKFKSMQRVRLFYTLIHNPTVFQEGDEYFLDKNSIYLFGIDSSGIIYTLDGRNEASVSLENLKTINRENVEVEFDYAERFDYTEIFE